MFKIFAKMSKQKTLKKELGINFLFTCWYQELFKIKGVSELVFYEGLRYKTLRFYDKAVTKHNYV